MVNCDPAGQDDGGHAKVPRSDPSSGAAMTLEPADRHLPRTEAGGLAAPASTETSRVLARRRHLVALPGRAGAGPGAPAGRGPFRDRVVLRSGRVHLGPGVGAADALAAEPVRVRLPLLAAVLARVARPPVRDRETVVGSLCCADPASALTAAAVALDARFTVSRPDGGTEELAATDFFADPHRVALPPGAAVVDVSFPVAPPGTVAGLHHL
jgi:hypothetical protein